MNILHLSSLALWDLGHGKGRVSSYLPIKGFVDKGHSTYFITNNPTAKSGNIDGIVVKKIKIPYSNTHPSFNLIMYPITVFCFLFVGIIRILKQKPEIIYAHRQDMALPAFLLSKLFNAKYVLRLYGIGGNFLKTTRFKPANLFRWLAFKIKADLYILTNDGTFADEVALTFGIPRNKIHFLKNGINKSWSKNVPNEVLKKQIAPNGEFILLSVSRLPKWKQVDIIIKALPRLISLNNNVKLVIVGDGPEEKNLKKLCADLNITGYVVFTGALHQEDIKDYMSIADIFISMNSLSSLSNPVFEAMICRKLVIALNKGTTKELIENKKNGILVEEEDIDKLPEIINDILIDNQLRERIGKNAQKYMLEGWPSWEERVAYEVELVEKLSSNR